MKTFVLAAAATLMTAPAFAEVPAGPAGAIAHFNADLSGNDVISVDIDATEGYSTRSGVNEAQIRFNGDYDGQDDVRRVTGGSVYSGTPTYGADIHDQIDAED